MFAPTTVSQNFVIIHTHKPKFIEPIYLNPQTKLKKPNLYNNRNKKIKIFATLFGYGKYY